MTKKQLTIPAHLRPGVKKVGLAPGSLVHIGEVKAKKVRLTAFVFTAHSCEEIENVEIAHLKSLMTKENILWLNVDGIHDIDIISQIGDEFGIHSLILEDILNTGQRPKIEDFSEYIFIVTKMMTPKKRKAGCVVEQVSIILGDRFVLSFQERPIDVFDPIRDRLRTGNGKVRSRGSDFLAYRLLDAIVDGYFSVIDLIGDSVESMETQVLLKEGDSVLTSIHTLQQEMSFLRKVIYPLRDVSTQIIHLESPCIRKGTLPYLRDLQDHVLQTLETIDTYRDMLLALSSYSLSMVSHRMNEVMKVLTLIATIFIPLTFIVGIYGMNFTYMPELRSPYGYPAVLLIMTVLGLSMLYAFWKKGWWK